MFVGLKQKLIVVTNFSWLTKSIFELKIPAEILESWKIKNGNYKIADQLYGKNKTELKVVKGEGFVKITI